MGRHLTASEEAHIAAVHEHMAAVVAVSKDPSALPRLAALLAGNFVWQTPSSDPARGVELSRDLYLAVVGNPLFVAEPERFVDLQLKILATTAQDDRVAGQAESYTARRDGTIYNNHYHQLWVFDAAGKIAEYRIYGDSEHFAALHAESNVKVVVAFLDCLSAGDSAAAAPLLADQLTWTLRTGGGEELTFEAQAARALIGGAHPERPRGVIAPVPDGITAQGNRVALEARVQNADENGRAEWRQFIFTLDQCRIQTIREYI